MSCIIDNKFEIGQTVYLVTDEMQQKRLVIGICIRQNGLVYELSYGSYTSWNYDFEISAERQTLVDSLT